MKRFGIGLYCIEVILVLTVAYILFHQDQIIAFLDRILAGG